jgi:hypothetical protein
VRVLWPVEHLNRHLGGFASTLESFNDGNLKGKNITAKTFAGYIKKIVDFEGDWSIR